MTELLEPHAIGKDLARRDGERKVRGTATYAYETPVDRPAYACIVQASVARGQVTGVDASGAEGLAGVLAVLTAENAERLASTDDRELAVLQSAEVAFRGQPVGLPGLSDGEPGLPRQPGGPAGRRPKRPGSPVPSTAARW